MKIVNTLFDGEMIVDRRSAGMMAQKAGALFEDQVRFELEDYNIDITPQPHFHCHFGLPRRGDFLINTGDKEIHIECKQLGNVQSHYDKLSHCLYNLHTGCYGKNFWLIYDYAKDGTYGALKKIHKLVERCKEIKQQVSVQCINFN